MRPLREWVHRLRERCGRSRAIVTSKRNCRLHMELAAEEARRRGESPERAARRPRLKAGNLQRAMEALRDQRGLPWLEDMARDLRYGCRMLARNRDSPSSRSSRWRSASAPTPRSSASPTRCCSGRSRCPGPPSC